MQRLLRPTLLCRRLSPPALRPLAAPMSTTTPSPTAPLPPAASSLPLPLDAARDDPHIRATYRPFLAGSQPDDWIAQLELDTVTALAEADLARTGARLKILVLYGSLRKISYSRLLAYEAARILHRLGCDVRVFDPAGLPVKDDAAADTPKVRELRALSVWSDGHVWVSPEMHGNITGVFKNQIDWIPLAAGSVRPTQGRTLAVAQCNGGSQSFNAVNALRVLGRWMRMFTIPNQSSVPMAWTQFAEETGWRMKESGNRARLVDCMEELVKYTIVMRPHFDAFADRFSERMERRAKEAKEAAEKAV